MGPPATQLAAMVHRATHDELTGLPNRKELQQRLDAALVDGYRHDRVVGVLFVDLDGFKDINDRMGHDAGDDLLRAFGQRLRAIVVLCQGAVRESAIEEVAGLLGRLSDVVLRDTTGQLSMWNELFASASVDIPGPSIGVIGAMTHDDGARAVVEASVSMARVLDLQVMAVGVETLEQRAMLEDLGIDSMQGFLFCRPLSTEDLEERGMIAASAPEGIGIE